MAAQVRGLKLKYSTTANTQYVYYTVCQYVDAGRRKETADPREREVDTATRRPRDNWKWAWATTSGAV